MLEFDFDRIVRNPFIAGAFGAFAGLKFAPGVSWAERFFNVAAGAMCAGFVAPGLLEWFRIETPGLQSFGAFMVGMFGLSFGATVTLAIRELKLAEIASGWLRRKG